VPGHDGFRARGHQVVEAFAVRFRQEDGFRDHTQRLGREECRGWTKEPVLRTFQVQMVALEERGKSRPIPAPQGNDLSRAA
jgi:hypothetical protein